MVKYLNISLFVLGCYLVYLTRDILFVFYISVLLAFSLNPTVTLLEKYRLPKGLSVFLVYVLVWTILGLLISLIIPPLVTQTRHLVAILPDAMSKFSLLTNYQAEINKEILSRISLLPQAIISISIGLFSNILLIFTSLVTTYYLLQQRNQILAQIQNLLDKKYHSAIPLIFSKIEYRLGNWLFGELALMVIVGTMTYIGLKILGVEVTLPLAIIAGLLELVPNIGPTLSAIPAILVALSVHPLLALFTAALYFIVQFVENNFLVPKIMQKAVGINPVLSIFGLMIGFRLAGPMGAILALPTIIVIETILIEIRK